jgi:hypothetical protein
LWLPESTAYPCKILLIGNISIKWKKIQLFIPFQEKRYNKEIETLLFLDFGSGAFEGLSTETASPLYFTKNVFSRFSLLNRFPEISDPLTSRN